MRLLYLARHGDYAGDELTDLGRQQSRLLGERLAGIPFAAIHHSTSGRAAQTAAIVAEHLPGVPLHPTELLLECIPPVADGEPRVAGFGPDVLAEGVLQAAAAVERFTGYDGPSPELLVSHGNLINWFVADALDAPPGAWLRLLDYHCSLTVLGYFPDRLKVISYNDMGHLPVGMRGTDYPPEARI